MRKITVILVALLFLCGISALGFAKIAHAPSTKKAQVKTEVIKGKIISIDTAKNEIVIKNNKTGTEKAIAVDPKVISSLKTDEEVKVTLKAGSNIAEHVKKLVKTTTSTKKSSK